MELSARNATTSVLTSSRCNDIRRSILHCVISESMPRIVRIWCAALTLTNEFMNLIYLYDVKWRKEKENLTFDLRYCKISIAFAESWCIHYCFV